jgi:hypothetical protein
MPAFVQQLDRLRRTLGGLDLGPLLIDRLGFALEVRRLHKKHGRLLPEGKSRPLSCDGCRKGPAMLVG